MAAGFPVPTPKWACLTYTLLIDRKQNLMTAPRDFPYPKPTSLLGPKLFPV